MDLRGLIIFMEAAELGSFTRTGEKLGYSQPTISFQIKQLEKELGAQLFDRIGHTVSLTDAGRAALPFAQQMVHMSQEMVLGANTRREPSGILRLGMADSLGEPLLVEHFGEFSRKYPKVSLNISTGDTGALLGLLDHNEVDMICTMDVHIYDTNYVIAHEEEIDVHFLVSPECPLAEQREASFEELMRYPFLLTEKGMSYRRLLDEKLAMSSMEIQPILETGRADLLRDLAEQNVGIVFLPDYITDRSVKSGRLVRLNVPGYQFRVWKQLLYRREKWLSMPMQVMINHMASIRLGSVNV